MARGDKVLVLLQVGNTIERYTAEAFKAGESLETNQQKFTTEISVMDRNGSPKRSLKFKTDAVLGLIELPRGDGDN